MVTTAINNIMNSLIVSDSLVKHRCTSYDRFAQREVFQRMRNGRFGRPTPFQSISKHSLHVSGRFLLFIDQQQVQSSDVKKLFVQLVIDQRETITLSKLSKLWQLLLLQMAPVIPPNIIYSTRLKRAEGAMHSAMFRIQSSSPVIKRGPA